MNILWDVLTLFFPLTSIQANMNAGVKVNSSSCKEASHFSALWSSVWWILTCGSVSRKDVWPIEDWEVTARPTIYLNENNSNFKAAALQESGVDWTFLHCGFIIIWYELNMVFKQSVASYHEYCKDVFRAQNVMEHKVYCGLCFSQILLMVCYLADDCFFFCIMW